MPEDDPEVVYYPGAVNHYDFDHNVVVLDSRLKEYPKAHDLIKQHELAHAENRSVPGFLAHELRVDARQAFGRDPAMEEVREYFSEVEPSHLPPLHRRVGHRTVNFARGFWRLGLGPLGWAYRKLASLGGDGSDA